MGVTQLISDVKAHLLEQGCRSTKPGKYEGSNQDCMYRGPNGTKCGIGFLIPDELYDVKMEGYAAEQIVKDYPLIHSAIVHNYGHDSVDNQVLSEIQEIHDFVDIGSWEEALDELIDEYGE